MEVYRKSLRNSEILKKKQTDSVVRSYEHISISQQNDLLRSHEVIPWVHGM